MTRLLTHFWRLAALACMCLGFQVHAERAALVTWWANPETDIAGYILCYGPAEQSFSKVIDVGNVTNVIVSDLIEGSTYYFAVKAYNTSGLQSELSEPVSLYVPTYTEVPKGAPVVGTRPPLSILATYAVLGGIINPRGESTAFWFEYGSDTNYGQVTAVQDLEGTNGMVLVKAVARWFEAGMTYHYRIVAFNKFGTNAGADWTFSTTILPPLLMISPVDGVISDRANLNAYVDPQGSDTIAWFEYGLDGQTNETEKVFIPGNGGMVPVNIRISKLQPESPYYFRLHATNQAGTVTSLDQSFLTGSPLAGRSVFLSWERGLNADIGGYLIRYGPLNAEFPVYLNVGLVTNYIFSGLSEGTTYLFHILPYDSWGYPLAAATELTMAIPVGKTSNLGPPLISESQVQALDPYAVIVTAGVNANGLPTGYWVEYGTDDHYGFGTAISTLRGIDSTPLRIPVQGLLPAMNYHYRVAASNLFDLVYSPDMVWTNEAVPPTATNKPVEMKRGGSPLLTGLVNPNGTETLAWFEYGSDQSYGQTIGLTNIGSGYSQVSVRNRLLELAPGNEYHFRLVAVNSAGRVESPDDFFSTPPVPPSINVESATDLTSHSAILHGRVNPGGAATLAWFAYGLDNQFGNTTKPLDIPAGNLDVPVSFLATDLLPGRTYFYTLVAQNSAGGGPGAERIFTTPPGSPTVLTQPPENISGHRALLQGLINPNGAPSTVWFAYGPNGTYETDTPRTVVSEGIENTSLSCVVSNLLPATTYAVRMMAFNSFGTALGEELTFTTATSPIEVFTLPATQIGFTNALLNGEVQPFAEACQAWFEYGLTTNYTFTSGKVAIAGTTNSTLTFALTDLTSSQTWHYRLVASNALGVATGEDLTFTTSSGLSVSTLPVLEVLDFEATLHGMVTSLHFPAFAFFQFGPSTNYTTVTDVFECNPGTQPTYVPALVEDLQFGTTYYYRIVASNRFETVYGTNSWFTTPP